LFTIKAGKMNAIAVIKSLLICCFVCLCISACKRAKNSGEQTSENLSLSELNKKYHLDKIKLPDGFAISVFAEVPHARSMCFGPKGTLFVGNKDGESISAVVDNNSDGVADKVYTIGSGMNMPNGVAFKNGSLYVAEVNRIVRFDNIEDNLANPPKPVVVTDKYPNNAWHGWKFIAFGPDDKLYIPVGAPCNVCEESDSIFASITRINADGSGREIFAKGIRNSVGFAWHPATKELWFTDNGRDNMGDDVPYCELNYAPRKGMHFGFPYCHQGDIPDPEFGKGKNCADYTPPARKLGPHVAPLGMRFYTGNNFPAEYTNQIFIAEHGSWNRSTPIGYKIGLAKLTGNTVTDYVPFASGWLQSNGDVLGRPVDVQVAADGALLVSDDYAGAIYRIVYKR
jgi:glucose/arabinose dehydrogenase